MQTATEKKRMITVTSRQINAAANSIKTGYGILAKDWAAKAVDIACNHHGFCEIEADSTLAGAIKAL